MAGRMTRHIYYFQDGGWYLMREIVITKHFSAEEVKKAIEYGIKLAKAYEKAGGEVNEE